jgi:hypothetical protein
VSAHPLDRHSARYILANMMGRLLDDGDLQKLGLDPKQYGANSMQAGFLTFAAAKGAKLFEMMDTSRHKSVNTLRGLREVGRCLPRSGRRGAALRGQ